MHAMSKCDTTSAMFGVGKRRHLRCACIGKTFGGVLMFGDLTTPKYILFEVGEKFVSAMYGASEGSLDALRYRQSFTSPQCVPLERMSPTSGACLYYHCLRIHL